MPRRDSTDSRKPRQLGLAPSRRGFTADVSINNPPDFYYNPSKQKATGSKNKSESINKKRRLREQQEWAHPEFNPTKKKATGAPTQRQLNRNKKEQLRRKLAHEKVIQRSRRA